MNFSLVWNLQGTPVGGADLGTPSAPPFMDTGRDDSNSEMESGTVHEIQIAEEVTKSHALNSDKKEQDSRCDPGERYNSLQYQLNYFCIKHMLLLLLSYKYYYLMQWE